jgi:tetratricopeptide (TPR) repeat protein
LRHNRHITARLALAVVATVTFVAAQPAGNKTIAGTLAAGQRFQSQGRYADAENAFSEAVASARETSDFQALARSMNYLASVKQIRGDYSTAGELYRAAIQVCDRDGLPPREKAAILLNEGRLYSAEGRFDMAAAATRQSLEIHESGLGPRHPSVSDSLDVLGWISTRRGSYAEAEKLYVRSVAIRDQVGDEAALAGTLNDFAFLLQAMGRTSEAEQSYLRALEIRRRLLGPRDPATADTMIGLAEVYRASRRFAKAEPLLTGSLPVIETVFGPDHSRVANACNNLGVLYCDEGRFADALPLFERALRIYEKIYGETHFHVASVLSNIALVQNARRQYHEAEISYVRALEIEERTAESDHPDVAAMLNNLGQIYVSEHRYADAEAAFARAIGIWERSAGPSYPSIAGCLANYAVVLRKLHRSRDAASAEARAAAIRARGDQATTSASVVDWHDLRRSGK